MTTNSNMDNPSRVQKQRDEAIVHHDLTRLIYSIRNQRVILDSDLAMIKEDAVLYRVRKTKRK